MIPGTEIKDRIRKIRDLMGVDVMIISKPKNLMYISGITSGHSLLTQDSCTVWTNEIEYETIKYPGIIDAELYKKNAMKDCLDKLKPGKIGIENVEINYYNKIKKEIDCEITVSDAVERARMVKSDYEIALVKKSAGIARKGMEKAYEVVSPGTSELKAAAEIEYEIRKNQSETTPFEHGMLLSSGKNSADIHGFPTKKKIKSGELVVVDLGARYGQYYSDMTRTIPAGKLKLNSKEAMAYEFIKNLELETIDIIKVGMKASDVHKFADDKIKEFKYKFHHSIGHGVGLAVQEMPHLNGISETVLCENMVFTIEPGIYVPGKFGVRFEDMVLLSKKRCILLTA